MPTTKYRNRIYIVHLPVYSVSRRAFARDVYFDFARHHKIILYKFFIWTHFYSETHKTVNTARVISWKVWTSHKTTNSLLYQNNSSILPLSNTDICCSFPISALKAKAKNNSERYFAKEVLNRADTIRHGQHQELNFYM